MKKAKRTKIISWAIIIISLVLVLFVLFSSNDLPSAIHALKNLNPKFFILGLLSYAGFIVLEGTGLYSFLRGQGYKVNLGTAVHFSFAGIFYANITPGASGGQPMQAMLMQKRNIPLGVSTSALTVRFFFNQLATVVSTITLWIFHRNFCAVQLGGVIPFVVLGLAVCFFPIPIVILVALHPDWTKATAMRLINFLSRHRIIRHKEKAENSVAHVLNNYHDSMSDILHHPLQLVNQFIISMLQYFCLMLVPVWVYYALGQHTSSPHQLLTVAYMLFTSAGYTPLPGASGAQEGGFLLYFKGMYEGTSITLGLLVWRFITFYLSLLLGAADSIYRALRKKRKPIDHCEK